MSDVVVRSSMKSGRMLIVSTGTAEVGVGGVITICKLLRLESQNVKIRGFLTEDLNCESEIVKETGRRAKDDIG